MSKAKVGGLAWPASWMIRQWKPVDEDVICEDCGRQNPVWWVESPLWNVVMGGLPNGNDPGGILCPTCFMVRAQDRGVGRSGAWQLYPPGQFTGIDV